MLLRKYIRALRVLQEIISEISENLFNENREKDAPWVLSFNPLFKKFGWCVFWEYEYVSGVLTKSNTHWEKY